MTETIIEERTAAKNNQWRERIAEQERSGLSVKQFCKERGLTECSFYAWRKRLRKKDPVRFALVERSFPPPRQTPLEQRRTSGGNRCKTQRPGLVRERIPPILITIT